VLEHVREEGGSELGSLRELRRVLMEAGVFVCCHLPNAWSVNESMSTVLHALSSQPRHHEYRFKVEDIHRLCAEAGLQVLSLGSYALLPRNILRVLPRGITDATLTTDLLNGIDDALASVFPAFCQNHFFVATSNNAKAG
jgi:hypothetical protein